MKTETKQPTAGHTPTPWIFAYGSIYQGDDADTVEENTGRLACMDRDNPRTTPTERDANARFIVTACNHHAELVEALKDVSNAASYINDANRTGIEINAEDWSVLHDRTQRAKTLLTRLNAK